MQQGLEGEEGIHPIYGVDLISEGPWRTRRAGKGVQSKADS
jgi:hypothetical protein